MNTKETLIMAEVKVRFRTVLSNITLTVLIRIQSTRIDVDIWIKFLDCYSQTSGLQKFG